VPAVVLSGLGTITTVALWTWTFPQLRRVDELTKLRQLKPAGCGFVGQLRPRLILLLLFFYFY
jgi:hypothetical protein